MPASRYRHALLAAAALAAGCATSTPKPAVDPDLARGREQMIRAFDAAWIRVIASGKDQEVLKAEPPNKPGLALQYMVRLADCLPQPEIAPWPEQPVGLFKEVLERGTLRRVVQNVPINPQSTSYYFSGISEKYLALVLDEINAHYGVKLKLEDVALPPGTLPATSEIVAGRADFVDQLNATGGDSQGLRRRVSRRFSCTMSASSQYVHIPVDSARAYMPKHTVTTKYINDLSGCVSDIKAGKADVIMNPLPSLSIADIPGYKSVHTLIVAGTPLWVAKEGIACGPPPEGTPGRPGRKPEEICVETSPP
jgi:hypothetical protein